MAAVAPANPGDETSTVIFPADFVDCTMAMHRPENVFRVDPMSGSWLVGSPLPVPITSPARDPEGDFVVGDRHDASLRVLNFDGEDGDVLAIGRDLWRSARRPVWRPARSCPAWR